MLTGRELQKEKRRLKRLFAFEMKAKEEGFKWVAGIDEVGRGPLAGPVVAAACVLPENGFFPYLNDSKQLTPEQRETLYIALTTHPEVDFGVGIVDHTIIDEINIYQATIRAMHDAILQLKQEPDLILVDGMALPKAKQPSWKMVKGDTLSQSIAAASVIAKVTRDRMMVEMHKEWPVYEFHQHKGYGTEKHRKALAEHGPCPIHRRSFLKMNEALLAVQDLMIE